MINYTKIEGGYKCNYENGVYIGDLLMKEDGFYDWWPSESSRGGYWPSYILRSFADKIDELNKPYEESIKEYFNTHPC